MSNQGKVADYSVLGMSLKSPIIVGSGLLSDQAKNIRQLVSGVQARLSQKPFIRSLKIIRSVSIPSGRGC